MLSRDKRSFAPLGLVLAGLAALATGVLYIIHRALTLELQISLALIIVGLALFVLLDPARTRQAFTGRQARYGSNALVLSIAVIGILVAVNYLVFDSTQQWDLTEDQLNSLTPETSQVLASLDSPVKAEAYFTPRMQVDYTRDLLLNYKNHASGKFDFEIIDPETDPIRAQQANITRDGTVVLRMDGRMEQIQFTSEEEITGALVRLANPGTRAVYFLTGHGEYLPDSSGENNYSQVRQMLEIKNYTVNTLNLLAEPRIPEDALALVVAGPSKPLTGEEIAVIQAYLESGGSLVYLAEPRPVTEFGDADDPMVSYLLETWGISLDENFIIDQSSNRLLVAVSNQFADHPITRKLYSMVVVMPSARTVRAVGAPDGVQLTELAFTAQNAWGESDYASLESGQVTQDETDLFGPLSLAVAGVNNQSGARILVIGDSDFAGSSSFAQYGNGDFLLNGIDWAAEQEGLISLTPRQPTQRFLLPPTTPAAGLTLLGSVFVLPVLVLVTGITVWVRRRNRG
jgi:ABC-type uncharacterized transport system involved in gliding motility auxiliary subunit